MELKMSKWKVQVPDCYMTFSKGNYGIMYRGFAVCSGEKTMDDAIAVAIEMGITMASISWNEDIDEWVSAHSLGKGDYIFVPDSTKRYSVEE
jgi:hypothetical protein